jgi:hypothetical protein
VITDLDKAPRNARGMVEFSSPFLIIKPVDMSQGNRKIFATMNNRGNDALLNATSVAPGSINELYLRLGYAIVDIGWEAISFPRPRDSSRTCPSRGMRMALRSSAPCASNIPTSVCRSQEPSRRT